MYIYICQMKQGMMLFWQEKSCDTSPAEQSDWLEPIYLQWRHNERDDVSNHRRLNCSFNYLFRCSSKKTSKHCVTRDRRIPLTKGQ